MRIKCLLWLKVSTIISAFFYCNMIFSQAGQAGQTGHPDALLPKVITGSPEAASLGKFGEWPVSEYTGVPNISMPIYTIKIKELEIPVQLSYHAGGVKVDEVASWAGVGWALNAGGAITRTVVGLADDETGGMIERNHQGNTIHQFYDLPDTSDYVFFRKIQEQQYDPEPDVYYYNFAGVSGKFCFDANGDFHAIPANSLKIIQAPFVWVTGGQSNNTQWIVADEKGNTYYFGSNDVVNGGINGIERTNSGNFPLHAESQRITSWYLTKIVAANRADTINFDYAPKEEYYYLPRTLSLKYLTNESGLVSYYSPTGGTWELYLNSNVTMYNGNPQPGVTNTASKTTGASQLKKISWRGGEVDLVAKTVRQDMNITASNMLDSVKIYNASNNVVKTFTLFYTFTQNRYFLDSLNEIGSTGASALKTSFEYINRSDLPPSPSMTGIGSYSQDHWGYYNGAPNTTLLTPSTSMPSLSWGNLTANREPDTVKMQFGTLKKIFYPTGGSTLFEYESNRYDPVSPAGGYNPPSVIVTQNTTVQGNFSDVNHQLASINITPSITQSNVSITVNVHNYGHPPAKNMSWMPYLKFGTSTVQQYYGDAFDNWPAAGVTPNSNGLYDYSYTITNLSMNSGTTYSLDVSDTCLRTSNCLDYTILPYISATIHYSVLASPPESGGDAPLPIAGGLRLKRLTNFNSDGSTANKKLFSYQPGKLLRYPKYYRHYKQDETKKINSFSGAESNGVVYPSPNWADLKEETTTSQVIPGFTQGAPVGYTQVIEEDLDGIGNDNGYTVSGFSYVADSLNGFYDNGAYWSEDIPSLTQLAGVNDFDYKRGLLTSKETYKRNTDNSFIKVYSLTNDFNFNDYNTQNRYSRVLGLRLVRLRFTDLFDGADSYVTSGEQSTYMGYILPSEGAYSFSPDFGYSTYSIISGWVQNTRSTETMYDQNGLNPQTKITNNYYDNPLHLQATRMVTTRSNGDSVVSLINYAQDYAGGTPFIDSMVAHNVISTPIESVTYKVDPSSNRTILSGKIMTFKPDGKRLLDKISMVETNRPVALSSFKFSNAASGLLPYNVAAKGAFTPDSRYQDKVTIAGYDAYANTLEQYKVNDSHSSYVWDYNNVYPVAEVKNALQTEIAFTSFESDGSGNWTIPSTVRSTSSAVTGSQSYSLNNGSISKSGLTAGNKYVVSYWSSGGSYTVSGSTGVLTGKTVNIGGTNWTYYEHSVAASSAIVTISGSGAVDELRLYPSGALMTSYTYIPLVGISTQCDAASHIVYYEYDDLKRLKLIRDQDKNIVKRYDYQYQQNP